LKKQVLGCGFGLDCGKLCGNCVKLNEIKGEKQYYLFLACGKLWLLHLQKYLQKNKIRHFVQSTHF
jgi:hypothetical protein